MVCPLFKSCERVQREFLERLGSEYPTSICEHVGDEERLVTFGT